MKLLNDLHHPDIGLLPIGGRFTMSISDVIYACKNFFSFKTIAPRHYNTFSPICANPKTLQSALPETDIKILDIGQSTDF